MKSSVHIETKTPSFYHEVRTEPDMVARRAWTREWCSCHRKDYELFTSDAVIDELERGDFPNKDGALSLVKDLPTLEINQPVIDAVSAYISHHLKPADPTGDAFHLAIASSHKIDFDLTWNCRHLANANKFAHIRRINGILGLFVPSLIMPLELLGEAESP